MTRIVTALVATLTTVLATGIATCVTAPARGDDKPLAGRTIVIDPGHQLGNANPRFRAQVNRKKFNGTISKPCNTTGTATNAGLPEATFNWRVAQQLRRILQDQGARVVLTRAANTYDDFGPCIWNRPEVANRLGADLLVSLHADGAASSGRGFHVIAPVRLAGWTDDNAAPSRRLARSIIRGMTDAGVEPTTYLHSPLSVRADQSTLNFSDVPAVVIEMGNMRNRADARRMSSSEGPAWYAHAVAAGIGDYLGR